MREQFARLVRPHHGALEALALTGLYGVYELVRGLADGSWPLALRHADEIVALERQLGLFWEWDVQRLAQQLPGLPSLLGFAYVTLHIGGTMATLVWVHRRHRAHFALVRTAVVVTSAFALVVYVVYPAAPPRLANLGFADTVTLHTGVNLNSALLGRLYNPIAAVPSLHFGYALLVGLALATLARRRAVRAIGAAYPGVMLFVIVATGNHFWLDAAAGAAVVGVGWLVARRVVTPEERQVERPATAAA